LKYTNPQLKKHIGRKIYILIIMHYYQNSQSHEGDAEDENGFVHFERRRSREIFSGDAGSF